MEVLSEPVGTGVVERPQPSDESPSTPAAVFTAVEGTLLDFETFEASAARRLLRELARARVPVVPVTVMTLDEMVPLAEDLQLFDPMIIEAGGAIARWKDNGWCVEPLGPSADSLIDAICEVEQMSGADLVVYSVLPEREAARVSGRHGAMLHASLERHFSEPFLIERGSIANVAAAADSLGFNLIRGQRFYYLVRKGSDALAFDIVRRELRCATTIAVGGSAVDAAFLSRSDIPIIIPRPDGHLDRELLLRVPHAIVAPAPGDLGWALAVKQVWTAIAAVNAVAAMA